jgi:hypothetical protein
MSGSRSQSVAPAVGQTQEVALVVVHCDQEVIEMNSPAKNSDKRFMLVMCVDNAR